MRDLNKRLETRARGIETLEISLHAGGCTRLAGVRVFDATEAVEKKMQ